jgi:hypothetical protein
LCINKPFNNNFMNLHIIKIDNQSIALWQNEKQVWQFCTGAEERLTAQITGGYDFSKCGRFKEWAKELDHELEFDFLDIDKIVNNGHINMKITEEFYIKTLIESDNAYTEELFAENELYCYEINKDLRVEFYEKITSLGIVPNDYIEFPEKAYYDTQECQDYTKNSLNKLEETKQW